MFNPDPRIEMYHRPAERPEAWHLADLRASRGRPQRWWHRLRVPRPVAARLRVARPGYGVGCR